MALELTQETTSYVDPDGEDSTQTLWFDSEGVHVFTFDHDYLELWNEIEIGPMQYVAGPSTLAEARTIIEKQGHTTS